MDSENVIKNLNIAKLMLCEPQMLNPDMCIRIGQAINDAITLLEGQKTIVRCKDCKFAHKTYDGDCKYCDMFTDDDGNPIERYRSGDWFCADGKRRECIKPVTGSATDWDGIECE